MAVLSRALALACLSACYSPDLSDCAVTCASSSDCAGAQVCGADHFCAVPELAGTCAPGDARAGDAAADAPRDAGNTLPVDATPPDAPATGELHLMVMGHGQLLAGTHACMAECTYEMPLVPIDVIAMGPHFEHWTEGPCAGSHATTCTVTPPATVGARFGHGGDH